MLQEIWSDNFLIQENRSVVLQRSHAPHKENAFQEPVEGNNFRDVQREEFKNGEHCENDPVC